MGHWVLIAFLVLIIFVLPYLLFLLGKDAEKTEQKINEIKTSKLPEHIDFFYSPVSLGLNLFAGITLLSPVCIFIFVLWVRHSQGKVDDFGSEIILIGIFLPISIWGAFLLRKIIGRWYCINQPVLILTRDGFLFQKTLYSWDAVKGVSVVGYKTHQLVFELNQDSQNRRKNKITIRLGDIRQPWLSVYAEEYLLRYQKAEQM